MDKTKYQQIKREFLKRLELDQDVRKILNISKMKRLGRDNVVYLKSVLDDIGYPDKTKIGAKASKAAFVMAQHADRDINFQKKYLRLMKKSDPKYTEKKFIAYLDDRIRVAEGKRQYYGTQFKIKSNGELEPQPIFKPKELDKRRKIMGLSEFSYYRRKLENNYKIRHKNIES